MDIFYILVVVVFFVLPGFGVLFLLWWMHKNDMVVKINSQHDGAFVQGGFRGRVVDGKIYAMLDILRRRPLAHDTFWWHETKLHRPWYAPWRPPIAHTHPHKSTLLVDWDDIKMYVLLVEGIPVISAKRMINLAVAGSGLAPSLPPSQLKEDYLITNTMMVRNKALMVDLYEMTKNPLTRNEMLLKLALPMGLILLALAVYVLFPKVYGVIMGNAPGAYNAAREGVWEFLKGGAGRPVG